MHMTFAQIQKVCLAVGVVALLADLVMVAEFGWAMSFWHAVALTGATIFAAIIWPIRRVMIEMGAGKVTKSITAVAGGLAIVVALFSDFGFSVSMRSLNTVTATTQTANYDTRQNQLKQNAGLVTELRGDLDKLKTSKPTVLSDTPDGVQAQLEAAQKAIDLEAKRGGCKDKCLLRMKEKAALEDRLATSIHYADLAAKLDAALKTADKTADTAVATKQGFSSVKAQTEFTAQLANAIMGGSADEVLHPGEVPQALNSLAIAFLLAVGATFLPEAMIYMGTFNMHAEPQAPRSQPAMNPAAKTTSVPTISPRPMRVAVLPTNPGVLRQMPVWAGGTAVAA